MLDRFLVCFVVLFLHGCTVLSGMNFREGIHSFQVQDYRHAFIRLKPEAEKGQPDAQYAIGYMYYYGQGVNEDRKLAYDWISRAARAGQTDAIEALKRVENESFQSPATMH